MPVFYRFQDPVQSGRPAPSHTSSRSDIGSLGVVADGVDVEDDGEDGGGEPADWPGEPDAAGAAEGGEDV